MLITFSVSNFRSIGNEQTLNLVASKKITGHKNHLVPIDDTQESVLRAAVIYGANAAGKSNIVRAMASAQQMVKADVRPLTSIEPFRFSPEFAGKPTSFEFRFLVNNHVFIYGFDVKGREIIAEWLSVLVEGSEERLVFERDQNGKTTPAQSVQALFPADSSIAALLSNAAALPLTPHQLFLNRVKTLPEEAQSETLRGVLRWLTRDLVILLPDFRSSHILDRIEEDSKFRQLAEAFLDSVGTGVRSFHLAREEVQPGDAVIGYVRSRLPHSRGALDDVRPKPDESGRYIARKLFAMHPVGASSVPLPFAEESDGTQQLLHLMPLLAAPVKETKVFVVDELDRSLHPLICWEFIKLFSESAPQAHKQLIVTTHEVHLLDQDLLRRDEYWFVEKDNSQQTQLVSLSDFNVRNDLQIEKGYLHGRFGGIPVIGPLAEIEKLLTDPKV